MPWITLSSDSVRTRLSDPELSALQSAALGTGQTNPLPEIVRQVVNEVRGYVAAHSANKLGAGETLPNKLEGTALAMIRYRLITRLPDVGLLTDERKQENRDALTLLRDVAAGRYAVEEPDQVDATERLPSPTPLFGHRSLQFGRQREDGI